jgi:hypothetical protein
MSSSTSALLHPALLLFLLVGGPYYSQKPLPQVDASSSTAVVTSVAISPAFENPIQGIILTAQRR